MGYESKIYIAEKGTLKDDDGRTYARIIAMFDMCKCYDLSRILTAEPKTNCYFYEGNKRVLKDAYGDDLTETTTETVIDILEEMVENGDDYRRIFPLLSTLKVISEQQKKNIWAEIVVLHYGY